MNKDNKKDEENKSLYQVRMTEDFLQKLKITTNISMRHMTLDNPESCAVGFIKGLLKARGNYQWSEDAFVEAIRLYPQYCHSMH